MALAFAICWPWLQMDTCRTMGAWAPHLLRSFNDFASLSLTFFKYRFHIIKQSLSYDRTEAHPAEAGNAELVAASADGHLQARVEANVAVLTRHRRRRRRPVDTSGSPGSAVDVWYPRGFAQPD